MNQTVGKGQIADGIVVLVTIEVVAVVAECLAQTVAIVEHGSNAVEAETVKMVLAEPVLAVAQQEVHHLVLSVVEAEAVPSRMLVSVARIEILVRVAGKIAQTFQLVLHGVRVHDVHDDCDSVLMGRIDEVLQFLRRSESAACCEEAAHVVAEGAVVRMLLDSHDLDAVVTVLNDTWQHVFLEFRVGAHLLGILSHSDVALVDEQRSGARLEGLLLPLVRFRAPHLCRENLGLLVLNHTVGPCRDSLAFSAFPVHLHLEEVAVLHRLLRHLELPVACALDALGAIFRRFLPVVEVTNQIDVGSIRCPLAEHPTLLGLVQSEVVVSVGKVAERNLTVAGKLAQFPECMFMTAYDGWLKVCQVWVVLYQSYMFGCSSLHCFLGCSLLGTSLGCGLRGCCLLS